MTTSILGVHFHNGANIFQLMFKNRLFVVQDKKNKPKPCVISRSPGGFANLRKSLPDSFQHDLVAMQERFAAIHAQLQLEEQTGLHTVYEVREPLQGRVEVGPEDALGVFFTFPIGPELVMVDFVSFKDDILLAPALLAHTCQGYFNRLFTQGKGLLSAFTAEYLQGQAATAVLGSSRQEVESTWSQAAMFLSGVVLDDTRDQALLSAQPEARQLLSMIENPLEVDLPPVEIEAVGQLPTQGAVRQTAWGISSNPLEAYRFLNRYTAMVTELFPGVFSQERLKGARGFTYLVTDADSHRIVYTAIKNRHLAIAEFVRSQKPQAS